MNKDKIVTGTIEHSKINTGVLFIGESVFTKLNKYFIATSK